MFGNSFNVLYTVASTIAISIQCWLRLENQLVTTRGLTNLRPFC